MSGARTWARAAVVAAALAAAEAPAKACENAVRLSADARIKMLQEAEVALDEGEVLRARELALGARHRAVYQIGEQFGGELLAARADRLIQLSYARDPDATAAQRAYAVRTFGEHRAVQRSPDPIADADYAEALSRIPGGQGEAYAILEPLARKDLIGSPNALGALHRTAKERGDEPTAYYAKARCEGMIGASPVCRGDYPPPPLIRGNAWSYLPHALLALAALGYRLLRKRRLARGGVLSDGRSSRAPWVGHAAPLQALALLGGAVYVFARATSPTWTGIVFAVVLLVSFAVERRAFFAAVRRGRIAGLVLRPAVPGDAHLPALALLRAPSGAHTLEHEHTTGTERGYREAARPPLLRLERRRVPAALAFAVAAAVVVLLLLTMFAFLARGV